MTNNAFGGKKMKYKIHDLETGNVTYTNDEGLAYRRSFEESENGDYRYDVEIIEDITR